MMSDYLPEYIPVENDGTCKDCIYFDQVGEGHGECKRFPPQMNRNDIYGYFVNVFTDDWCGEHKPK